MGYSVLYTFICDLCGSTHESNEKDTFTNLKPFGWFYYPNPDGSLVCDKHMIIAKLVDI